MQHDIDAIYTNVPSFSYHTGTHNDYGVVNRIYRVEEISDVVALRPQVFVDPVSGSWKRIKYPPSKIANVFRPSHPCTHTKAVYHPVEDVQIAWGDQLNVGNPLNEHDYRVTDTFSDGASYLRHSGVDIPLDTVFNDAEIYYTAEDYRKHDWFALADSFYESCDQFIPSSFNLGEDIAECSIFKEALYGVFFPTRAINRFLKHVVKHVKRSRKMSLGQISKEVAKQGANTHLSYIFGVKPAIDDIKALLHAHKSVSQRMSILRSRAGHYVPIRVKQKLLSPFENSTPVDQLDNPVKRIFLNCDAKSTTAYATAFGRVREDLTFEKTWSAYLQYFGINKVVGLAWELIPFSFVLDWFTNAQERINSMTRLNTGGPFNEIRNLSVSMKQTVKESLYVSPYYNFAYGLPQVNPTSPTLLATREVSRYERYLTFPDTSGVFDFSALGLFQITASASLLLQKMLAR
jgi:hypothetical protein